MLPLHVHILFARFMCSRIEMHTFQSSRFPRPPPPRAIQHSFGEYGFWICPRKLWARTERPTKRQARCRQLWFQI